MTKIWSFLTGKKTYLAAIALAVLAVAGFWFQEFDITQAMVIFSMAFGLVGLGHKFDRQAELVLHELDVYKKTKKLDVPAIEKEVLSDVVEQSIGRVADAASGGTSSK